MRRSAPERSLAAAWNAAPGCPDPQVFLHAAWSTLDEKTRQNLESHVADCPACAAERELARAFDEGEESTAEGNADVDWIVTRLERGSAGGRGAKSRAWVRYGSWAAAAVLVVGVAAAYLALRPVPPPLPAPPEGPQVLRGTDLAISAPEGDLAEAPRVLRFSPVVGAARYHVRLLDVGDDVLWEESVAGSPARIPAAVREELRESVTYDVEIEAVDATGARLAAAGQVSFRIVPAPAKHKR